LENQQPARSKGLSLDGIAVKLFNSQMSNLTSQMEQDTHTNYCRVWMEGEFEVIETKEELDQLKEMWRDIC